MVIAITAAGIVGAIVGVAAVQPQTYLYWLRWGGGAASIGIIVFLVLNSVSGVVPLVVGGVAGAKISAEAAQQAAAGVLAGLTGQGLLRADTTLIQDRTTAARNGLNRLTTWMSELLDLRAKDRAPSRIEGLSDRDLKLLALRIYSYHIRPNQDILPEIKATILQQMNEAAEALAHEAPTDEARITLIGLCSTAVIEWKLTIRLRSRRESERLAQR
jgi:hypothetical protein